MQLLQSKVHLVPEVYAKWLQNPLFEMGDYSIYTHRVQGYKIDCLPGSPFLKFNRMWIFFCEMKVDQFKDWKFK